MLNPGRFIALTFTVLAALAGVGYVQGVWTDRWGSEVSNQEIREMEKVPMSFGAWEGKTIEATAAQQILPDAGNFLRRRYVSRIDGTVATVLVTCGRPGPLVTMHLPTECYPGNGYELVVPPKRLLTQNKVPDEFWVATFKKTSDVVPLTVRVYWSWSANGWWKTPESPRYAFAHNPLLYKLYVIQTLPNEYEKLEGAPVHDFIQAFTNEMRGSFFTSASK